jgi:hypothetical protein
VFLLSAVPSFSPEPISLVGIYWLGSLAIEGQNPKSQKPKAMEKFAQLQGLVEQLTAAAKALSKHHDDIESAEDALAVSESESDADAKQARASILASTAAIRMLLGGPAEFLQHLAAQVWSCLFLSQEHPPRSFQSPFLACTLPTLPTLSSLSPVS